MVCRSTIVESYTVRRSQLAQLPVVEDPKLFEQGRFGYLISAGTNPKTIKSDNLGEYLTAILNLWPGSPIICPAATKACIKACLNSSGNPAHMAGKERARKARTALFLQDRAGFKARLCDDLEQHRRICDRRGVKPAARLNGTSDIVWELIFPEVFDRFADFQFYDYSKIAARFRADWTLPANYDLTLSYSGENWADCETALNNGHRIAAVFGGITPRGQLPTSWRNWAVVDGDLHDLTFSRGESVILGLRAKGKARKPDPDSKFVIWDHV